MDSLLKQKASQERIRACYHRGIDRLVKEGVLTPSRAVMHKRIDDNLIDLQLQPKALFWHSPHKLSRSHILEVYPRTSQEDN